MRHAAEYYQEEANLHIKMNMQAMEAANEMREAGWKDASQQFEATARTVRNANLHKIYMKFARLRGTKFAPRRMSTSA